MVHHKGALLYGYWRFPFFFRVNIARRSFPSFSTEFEGLEYNLGGMVVVSIASIIYGVRNQRSWPTRLRGRDSLTEYVIRR